MRLAVHYWNFSTPGGAARIASTLRATAQAADAGGVTAMTVMDHWFQMEARAPAEEPMLEGYTTLGYLAGVTERLRLGTLVTGVTYRHPGLLAKTVATLDVLSGGRAFLGIGAAWYEREHRALGVPFPPLKERFERLEETLQIVQQMWSDDDGPYQGTHYSLAETLCHPAPLQTPRPPILIGGGGEKKTLRFVARYGDACNLFDVGPDELGRKIEVLRGHCADVGRDPSEIDVTVTAQLDDDRDAFLDRMRAYAALGVGQVWLSLPPEDPTGFVERACADVLPELQRL
ncbi:LLM class F420-dependent oxidoreductase [uncultured Amnibacterium sp.]|uniref:LLM class F420-dependent oxidoreductase n=1 Tax=uncultured Amnibacterium sp. TaxID=1631851 RepID=UPI0035CC4FF2